MDPFNYGNDSFEDIVDRDALELIFNYFETADQIPFLYVSNRWKDVAKKLHCRKYPWREESFQTKSIEKVNDGDEKVECVRVDWYVNYPARKGYFDLVKWCKENGCPWSQTSCEAVATSGDLEMMKWAHSAGLSLDSSIYSGAARIGSLEIMKWALSNGISFPQETHIYSRPTPPSIAASERGFLDCIVWMKENNFNFSSDCISHAVCKEHFEVAKYLRDNVQDQGKSSWYLVHQIQSVKILEWLNENLPHSLEWKKISSINHEKHELFVWCTQNGVDMRRWDYYVLRVGNLESLMLGVELGLPFDFNDRAIFFHMLNSKNLKVMKWLFGRGVGVPQNMTKEEIRHTSSSLGMIGSIQIYEWFREIGFPINHYAMISLCLLNERMELLSFVMKKKYCKWGKTHFIPDGIVLEKAIKLGLRLSKSQFQRSCKWNNPDVLIILNEKGCPWGAKKCFRHAYRNHNYDAVMWIYDNNPDPDLDEVFSEMIQKIKRK